MTSTADSAGDKVTVEKKASIASITSRVEQDVAAETEQVAPRGLIFGRAAAWVAA